MKEKAKVKLLAGTMSVLFHLSFLILLCFVQASGAKYEENNKPELTTRVSQIKRIIQNPSTVAKPKIYQIAGSQRNVSRQAFTTGSVFVPDSIIVAKKTDFVDINDKPFSKTPQMFFPDSGSSILRQPAVLFGSRTDRRWISYLVDCSGSMSGMFGWVQQQLTDSIAQLRQDQHFRIIFFGNDKIFEFNDGLFSRANDKNKSAACDYISKISPAGGANTIAALAKAIKPQDAVTTNQVIYFLTDGFELVDENISLEDQISELLKNNAVNTQINTIGFWPQQQDRKMLETLAQKSGGTFILVTDEHQTENTEQNEINY